MIWDAIGLFMTSLQCISDSGNGLVPANSWSEIMMTYCQFDPNKHTLRWYSFWVLNMFWWKTSFENVNHKTTSWIQSQGWHSGCFNTLRRDKMATISQTTFPCAFPWMKLLVLNYNFTEICSLRSNWQYGSIGSDNGLAPNRRHAIIWTNYGLGY